MQGFPEGYDQDIIYNSSLSLLSGPIADEKKVDSTVDLTRNDARIITNVADTCIPFLIAGYSSHINIRGGRQIELVS